MMHGYVNKQRGVNNQAVGQVRARAFRYNYTALRIKRDEASTATIAL